MKSFQLTLLVFIGLVLLVKDTVARSLSEDVLQKRAVKSTSIKKAKTVQKAHRVTVNAIPSTKRVTYANVTGWAKRLTVSSSKSKTVYDAGKNAVGLTPRYVAWGNYILQNTNSIGVPDPSSDILGLTHYNLAFWVSKGGNSTYAGDVYTGAGNALEWSVGDKAVQRAIVQEFNKYGIRLGVSVFGAVDTPLSDGLDPTALAKTVAGFVKNNNLQGVDVDFEEFNSLTDWSGKGAAWLVPFIKTLRSALPRPTYYISAAPVAPLFNAQQFPNGFSNVVKQVGSLIDFYNVQFYNQQGSYATCNTLLRQSDPVYPNSSFSQLIGMWNVPSSKLVIGKPAHTDDANTFTSPSTGQSASDGYMTPQLLMTCLRQARQMNNWRGGVAWWQYKGKLQDVIRPARSAINIKTKREVRGTTV